MTRDEDAQAWRGDKTRSMEEVEPLLASGDSALGELSSSDKPSTGKRILMACGCLLLVAILAVVAASIFLAPQMNEALDEAKGAVADAHILSIGAALDAYAQANDGRYPDTLQELVMPDENGQTWYEGSLPADPWGGIYQYTLDSENQTWELRSNGADGIADPQDPILTNTKR